MTVAENGVILKQSLGPGPFPCVVCDKINPVQSQWTIAMQPGDRVRVKKSIIVYSHPKHRLKPFDMHGQEGEVKEIISTWKEGEPLSATLPVVVMFGRTRFHFHADELELC